MESGPSTSGKTEQVVFQFNKDASRQSSESGNGRVLQVGAPCHSAGRQFLLAHVDPKSGRVKKWTSGVKVYNFEARHVQDVDTFLGRKSRPVTNYMRDFDADEDNSKAEQKRLLATDFGSAKRMKMVQQAVKRHVKEETMESMVTSALTNVVDSSGQTNATGDKKERETSGITMIQQVTSTLLPVANEKAATPAAIYSLDTFITEEGMQSLSEEVDTFMKLTAKTALESELHVLPVASALHTVAKAYGAAPTDTKTFELAAKLYYLGCLAKVVRYVNKEARTRVQLRDVDFNNMRIANCAKMLITTHFFQRPAETTSRMRAAVYPMPKTSKDRLLAYTLCLAIILSPSLSLDVGYWCTALGVPDKRAKDLCRALGCNVAATKSSGGVMKTVATLLHTPLQASKQNAQKFGGRARK